MAEVCVLTVACGLAAMYGIGVVGAITADLGSCALNRQLPVRRVERVIMTVTFLIVAAIGTTIAVTKLRALLVFRAANSITGGVDVVTINAVSDDPAWAILDNAAIAGVDVLIVGHLRRSALT
jgi:uncharacterized protein YacL